MAGRLRGSRSWPRSCVMARGPISRFCRGIPAPSARSSAPAASTRRSGCDDFTFSMKFAFSTNPGRYSGPVASPSCSAGTRAMPGPAVDGRYRVLALGRDAHALRGRGRAATLRSGHRAGRIPRRLICTSSAVERMVRSVTDDYASYLRERHGGSPGIKVRLETIPLGVDVDRFRPATPEERGHWRSRLHVEEDEVAVLFVGRLAHHAKAHPFPMFRGVALAAESTGRRIHLLVSGGRHREILDAFLEARRVFASGVKVTFIDGMDPRLGSACGGRRTWRCRWRTTFRRPSGSSLSRPWRAAFRSLRQIGTATATRRSRDGRPGANHDGLRRLRGLDGPLFGAIDYDRFLAETSQTISVDAAAAGAAIGRLVRDDAYRGP